MEYKIIADGACDLYGENADKIGVQIVPFYVAFEENVYKKEKHCSFHCDFKVTGAKCLPFDEFQYISIYEYLLLCFKFILLF